MTPKQFIKITEWQKQTFGESTALSKAYHLRDEVIELLDSLVMCEDGIAAFEEEAKKEFADCFILLYGAAAAFGLSLYDINQIIAEKHAINLKRKWGKPDANGVVNHIKE